MASSADLRRLTLADAREALRKGETTSEELTRAHLEAMEQAGDLNAYITQTREKALAMAKASDAVLQDGEPRPLEGIPLGIKDLFCTTETLTTAASKILGNFRPPYESTVTANLWQDGAVMLGKLNMDEFAMGSANTNSAYGPATNPWTARGDDRPRVPGGSSGGSAAAVAAGLAMGTTGTDTGGSIRQPAAFCGVPGIKPTYGRCSRYGIVAFASSLDQAGPIARTVRDNAILLRSMASWDDKDSTSINAPVPDYEAALGGDLKGLRIGVLKECRLDTLPGEIEQWWDRGAEWLRAAGAEVVEVTVPTAIYGLPAYYILAPAEASSNLARYDGVRYGLRLLEEGDDVKTMYEKTRGAGFGAEVRRRILLGTYVLSAGYYDAYYRKAQRVRAKTAADFQAAFEHCDAILTPATPSAAFVRGEKEDDPVTMYLNDVFTIPANLAGLPAMSVPVGLDSEGLPLSLQVMGKPLDEATVFKVSSILEEAAGFDTRQAIRA